MPPFSGTAASPQASSMAVQGVTARVLPGTDKTARVRMPQASYRRTMMPLPSSARFTASTTTPGASTETKE